MDLPQVGFSEYWAFTLHMEGGVTMCLAELQCQSMKGKFRVLGSDAGHARGNHNVSCGVTVGEFKRKGSKGVLSWLEKEERSEGNTL